MTEDAIRIALATEGGVADYGTLLASVVQLQRTADGLWPALRQLQRQHEVELRTRQGRRWPRRIVEPGSEHHPMVVRLVAR